MRQDQFDKVQDIYEKLTDVFVVEGDPDNWSGAGLKPDQMTRETRGDRYWCKRNAVATLSMMARLQNLTQTVRDASNRGGGTPAEVVEEESELDKEIDAAEKEANKLIRELQTGVGKVQFDKKVHGKA